ncbi:hypothetical protein HZF24_04710 [Sedimentibacter hydroxybenzoicus DSM 7310]|uniref:PAS domain-containing protein n=1 Tax=Sedimentibacter hydroxybenzoicus DSM 7310 TaxID=1123245 RepID=A0A974GVV5_SEDHY|nr:PAS domain-containing protein [Sedimentibacter hydroxybenzoicus]NYB73435.1 hypothetical protein [Sedimentibacter hydroxybenzoicus DSM 7310]
MGKKTKEQLLSELLVLQKELEKKVQHQDQMIRRFQMLTANESLFSQIIDFCPYPIAVFTPQGVLETVNDAFSAATGADGEELGDRKLSIYDCISNNVELDSAIRQVFAGKNQFLDNLKNPLTGFEGLKKKTELPLKGYRKAIIFPIPAEGGLIMHGVAVFTI